MIILTCIHTCTYTGEILNKVVIMFCLLEMMVFEEKKWACVCVCVRACVRACVATVDLRDGMVLIYADMGGKEE